MHPTAAQAHLTSSDVKREASSLGFDLCGIAPAAAHPELEFFREWLDRGYAGDMEYLGRTADRRADVRAIMPTARSVISLATVYNTRHPHSTECADESRAAIARYAWGDDYHVVVEARLDLLVDRLRHIADHSFEAKAYVDTGPVQERVYAHHAGLGWIGKNTCLINETIGSWVFLSTIICNLPLEPDAPPLDRCGTCTLCLDACPTGALVEPRVLDATACLAYLTIETREDIPLEHRDSVGAHAYGCDVCQEVCPWNQRPSTAVTADPHWQPRPGLDRPRLLDLWNRSDDELRDLLKGSPMKRAGLARFRRNLAIAIGNSGDAGAVPALLEQSANTAQDPVVAEHVYWAVEKLSGRDV